MPVPPGPTQANISGPGVVYLGDAAKIGDSGASGGSGVPLSPPQYTVTSACSHLLPESTNDLQLQRVRVRVRNEGLTPLHVVRMAVAPLNLPQQVAVYDVALPTPLRKGRSGWVEVQAQAPGATPPAVWVMLPPLMP